MKKLLIALPFVATASWAGTTLYTGNQTRAAYDDLIAQLDGLNGMQVSTESYTSGFAASRAVTAVRASDAPDSSVLFRLRHEISHSPIGLDDGGARVGAARIVTTLLDDDLSEETRAVIERFDGGVPFVLESDVGFDRRVSNVLAVSPLSLDADGVVLELGAIRYDADIDPAGRIVGTGDHAGLELALTDDDVTFSVAPGTERFELERVGDGGLHRDGARELRADRRRQPVERTVRDARRRHPRHRHLARRRAPRQWHDVRGRRHRVTAAARLVVVRRPPRRHRRRRHGALRRGARASSTRSIPRRWPPTRSSPASAASTRA